MTRGDEKETQVGGFRRKSVFRTYSYASGSSQIVHNVAVPPTTPRHALARPQCGVWDLPQRQSGPEIMNANARPGKAL